MKGLYRKMKMEKEKKRRICLLVVYVLFIVCAMIYVNHRSNMYTVQASSANGTWGTCTWALSEDGVLTVSSGTGEDVAYVDSEERRYGTPWVEHSDNIKKMIFGTDGKVVFPNDCSDMFKAYTECENIIFTDVDTSAVTYMENMFEGCEKLQSIEGLEQFDTRQVEDMENFFSNCASLKVADVSSFNTACIQERNNYNLDYFFRCNNELEKIIFGEHFSFSDAYIKLPENTNWYKEGTPDQLIDYDQLSKAEWNGEITLQGTWLRAEGIYWGECKCTIQDKTLTIGAGKGGNRYNKFYSPWEDYAEEIEYIEFEDGVVFPEDIHELFMRLDHLKEIDFSNADLSQVKNTVYLFGYCASLKKVSMNAKLPAQPVDMMQTFASCYTLESVALGNLDTSKVESFNSLFYECYNLQSFDFDKIDISSAQYLGQMFQQCYQLRVADMSSWRSDKVMDISWMFAACTSLTRVIMPEQGLHIGRVNYSYGASSVFYNCRSLTSIENLDRLDTSGVEDMYSMFYGCKNLTALDLSSFDTSKVKTVYQMFYGCESLVELDLSSFDTTDMDVVKMIDGVWNYSMYKMFDGCDHLAKVTVGDKFVFKGGRSVKSGNTLVTSSGSLPANQVNPEHVNEWYIYQSDVDGEAGKWLLNYGVDSAVADVTDLEPAKRIFTKQENGTITAPKQRINFGDLQLKSNIKEQYEYTGDELRPEEGNTVLTAIIDGEEVTLQESVDYVVNYPAESYYIGGYGLVHFNGTGNYCGEYTVSYYVCKGTKVNIGSCVEWPGELKYTYTGSEIRPKLKSVMDGEKQLVEGRDYYLEYVNNTDVGYYYSRQAPRIYIHGKGDYVGSTYWSFTIEAKSMDSDDITAVLQKGKYLYTGSEVRPSDIIVKDGNTVLKEGKDYELSYWNNTKPGNEARVNVHGIGNYDGYKQVHFAIVEHIDDEPASNTQQPADATPTAPADATPTASAPADTTPTAPTPADTTPTAPTPADATPTAPVPADTTPTASAPADNSKPVDNNNTRLSPGQTTQTDINGQTAAKVKKLQKIRFKAGKKSIHVSWKKNNDIVGIEIQYASAGKKKMKWKTIAVSKAKKTAKIKKLKNKKKYTVRIRCYQIQTINNKTVKRYSGWVQKTIKTK